MILRKQLKNLRSGEKMKSVIVAHGYSSKDALKKEIEDADLIICSDGGAIYLMEEGYLPNVIIGDLDSINRDAYEYFVEKGVKIITYPREKDFSDTELCIDYALSLGANNICIISGIGSRIDHSLINISLLYKILKRGAYGYIATDSAYIYLCNKVLEITGNEGDVISLVPLTFKVSGINTKGLKYSLEDGTIYLGQSIGVSNEMINEKCSIEIKEGLLVVVKQNIL
ncbi:thiamine diphosphokinase [Thermobrachium celere]|uniref:thiamine diphosphokinase n=1 Tax=Thermobrachium celere TaxID=53422 RepID=UPI001940FE23|nr:thiamine diphosphokinase [Thermobrachium celere]